MCYFPPVIGVNHLTYFNIWCGGPPARQTNRPTWQVPGGWVCPGLQCSVVIKILWYQFLQLQLSFTMDYLSLIWCTLYFIYVMCYSRFINKNNLVIKFIWHKLLQLQVIKYLLGFFLCLSKLDLNANAYFFSNLASNKSDCFTTVFYCIFCRILSQFADVNTYSNIGMLSVYVLKTYILQHLKMSLLHVLCSFLVLVIRIDYLKLKILTCARRSW